jgi:hypothetical protein
MGLRMDVSGAIDGVGPRPVCFVAMGFGVKTPPGRSEPVVDFDEVYGFIERAVAAQGLECVRADFEVGGGFIHRAMYERLLVAEYVVADLTFANANVAYEVGVRHGASQRPTILIGADGLLGELPFDFRPLRGMAYKLSASGGCGAVEGAVLERGLGERLRQAIEDGAPLDNPIMHVTGWEPGGRLEHDKTDVFLERVRYASNIGDRIAAALRVAGDAEAVEQLAEIETSLLAGGAVVAELHSALIGVYLGYRERRAFQRMVDMYPRLPAELKATAVAVEQYALALNRLAEGADRNGDHDRSKEMRSAALAVLDSLGPALVTSETWGIRGRIFKGAYAAELANGNELKAAAMLARAIESYEDGVKADMRDYYPGVNAVTLRLTRGSEDDFAALDRLIPVVRMAVENAPAAKSTEEQYWRAATKLEMASAAKDWDSAREHLVTVLGLDARAWMHETTIENLKLHQRAFHADPNAVEVIDQLIQAL